MCACVHMCVCVGHAGSRAGACAYDGGGGEGGGGGGCGGGGAGGGGVGGGG